MNRLPQPVEVIATDTVFFALPPDTAWMPAIHDTFPQDTAWFAKVQIDSFIDTVFIEAHKGDEFAKAQTYISSPCSLEVTYYPSNTVFSFRQFAKYQTVIEKTVQAPPHFLRFSASVYLGRIGEYWNMGLGLQATIQESWKVGVLVIPNGWMGSVGVELGK